MKADASIVKFDSNASFSPLTRQPNDMLENPHADRSFIYRGAALLHGDFNYLPDGRIDYIDFQLLCQLKSLSAYMSCSSFDVTPVPELSPVVPAVVPVAPGSELCMMYSGETPPRVLISTPLPVR